MFDREGQEVGSLDRVREEALSALTSVVSDLPPDSDRRTVFVKVRDAEGRHVLHASLTLTAHWMA